MGGARYYARVNNRRLTVRVCDRISICAYKISEYALMCDMRLRTHEYGIILWPAEL